MVAASLSPRNASQIKFLDGPNTDASEVHERAEEQCSLQLIAATHMGIRRTCTTRTWSSKTVWLLEGALEWDY